MDLDTSATGPPGGGIVPGALLHGRDFVYVTFTTVGRHALATASRVWRKVIASKILQSVQSAGVCSAQLMVQFLAKLHLHTCYNS